MAIHATAARPAASRRGCLVSTPRIVASLPHYEKSRGIDGRGAEVILRLDELRASVSRLFAAKQLPRYPRPLLERQLPQLGDDLRQALPNPLGRGWGEDLSGRRLRLSGPCPVLGTAIPPNPLRLSSM